MGCPKCGGGGAPVIRQGKNHTEVHTNTRPTKDPQYPGGTFESRHARSNDGDFIGKTSVVKNSAGQIAEVKRGKNSKSGSGRGHMGFMTGLFNFLSK